MRVPLWYGPWIWPNIIYIYYALTFWVFSSYYDSLLYFFCPGTVKQPRILFGRGHDKNAWCWWQQSFLSNFFRKRFTYVYRSGVDYSKRLVHHHCCQDMSSSGYHPGHNLSCTKAWDVNAKPDNWQRAVQLAAKVTWVVKKKKAEKYFVNFIVSNSLTSLPADAC